MKEEKQVGEEHGMREGASEGRERETLRRRCR